MDFISNTDTQIKKMLEIIGVNSIEELFHGVPKNLMHAKPTNDDGLSEYEGKVLLESIANQNTFIHRDNYLGAGAYEHHVPAIVSSICSKSEFLTSYTPYQAEASQGMLQAIFEFQSAICALTGLDVANASVYDAASACAEAVLMALRTTKRNKILISGSLHPHYRAVIEQYLSSHPTEIVIIPFLNDGSLDQQFISKACNDNTAAILIQSPNFFGIIEETKSISKIAHQHQALSILCANPISYGIFSSAKEMDIDIAVGDCQPFGIPLQFGGPYAGYISCTMNLVRQIPGRIAGETIDINGKRGFVLTLQAREQHIRREKATSNICTNQALAALASLVAILWYGKTGIEKLALTNYQRTAYLKNQLEKISSIHCFSPLTCFNEFIIDFQKETQQVLDHFHKHQIEPGLPVERYFPELKNNFLIAVTETKSKEQLDRYIEVAKAL